ncbi:MAG: histidine phosphatase family protein [Chitinophagaceae bacterium]
MKTLLIVRHAKSSWADAATADIDRPLNERGKRDAPEMAKRVKEKQITIDQLLSSPAKRAHKTAKLFAEELGLNKDDILVVPELYEAIPETFYKVVAQVSDKHHAVALFSHNPGVTGFVNTLTPVQVADMTTCAVFAVSVEGNSWKAFGEAEKMFLFYDYPKNPLATE